MDLFVKIGGVIDTREVVGYDRQLFHTEIHIYIFLWPPSGHL